MLWQFQTDLLGRIDARDQSVLRVLRDFQDAVMEKYEEWREEQDSLRNQVGSLRRWKHERANKFEQQMLLRVEVIEHAQQRDVSRITKLEHDIELLRKLPISSTT